MAASFSAANKSANAGSTALGYVAITVAVVTLGLSGIALTVALVQSQLAIGAQQASTRALNQLQEQADYDSMVYDLLTDTRLHLGLAEDGLTGSDGERRARLDQLQAEALEARRGVQAEIARLAALLEASETARREQAGQIAILQTAVNAQAVRLAQLEERLAPTAPPARP